MAQKEARMHELQALLLYISNLLTYLLTDLLPHVRLRDYLLT